MNIIKILKIWFFSLFEAEPLKEGFKVVGDVKVGFWEEDKTLEQENICFLKFRAKGKKGNEKQEKLFIIYMLRAHTLPLLFTLSYTYPKQPCLLLYYIISYIFLISYIYIENMKQLIHAMCTNSFCFSPFVKFIIFFYYFIKYILVTILWFTN